MIFSKLTTWGKPRVAGVVKWSVKRLLKERNISPYSFPLAVFTTSISFAKQWIKIHVLWISLPRMKHKHLTFFWSTSNSEYFCNFLTTSFFDSVCCIWLSRASSWVEKKQKLKMPFIIYVHINIKKTWLWVECSILKLSTALVFVCVYVLAAFTDDFFLTEYVIKIALLYEKNGKKNQRPCRHFLWQQRLKAHVKMTNEK